MRATARANPRAAESGRGGPGISGRFAPPAGRLTEKGWNRRLHPGVNRWNPLTHSEEYGCDFASCLSCHCPDDDRRRPGLCPGGRPGRRREGQRDSGRERFGREGRGRRHHRIGERRRRRHRHRRDQGQRSHLGLRPERQGPADRHDQGRAGGRRQGRLATAAGAVPGVAGARRRRHRPERRRGRHDRGGRGRHGDDRHAERQGQAAQECDRPGAERAGDRNDPGPARSRGQVDHAAGRLSPPHG
ncbi:hypothetical protein Swit_0636 [Rhizorhabdus wittichii RW1]|uniref:Uncharacterized protein n=1 Tax=Rhizorhabdus wittichii (strain DSM 6014 / CCUG 31198 / JCM 15750 / NBRC 105917 / EY 4224 / RW1) TaxID=392499 RepID=A0A9J9H980_RHIWR|nr:hypothetical protein Swit_0636 [Rhizorhabdus wittichii RW1]